MSKLDESKNLGPHKELNKLQGKWKGIAKTWFEPGVLADESGVEATMKLVLDGRFILHEYTGSMQGKPLSGLAIYGYHLDLQTYQVAWIDSFHNHSAIMFSEGRRNTNDFNVKGSYAYITPETEQHWGWRTTIELKSENELVITAYNVTPDGQEAKATETIYNRISN